MLSECDSSLTKLPGENPRVWHHQQKNFHRACYYHRSSGLFHHLAVEPHFSNVANGKTSIFALALKKANYQKGPRN